MEDHDIPERDWLKQLKPTLQGPAQAEWEEMLAEDRRKYSRVKRRLVKALGLSESEKCRSWWELAPEEKEPIMKWHRRAEKQQRDISRGSGSV